MPGNRQISQRPHGADTRTRFGHWEIDTAICDCDQHYTVTLVERKTAYTLIGKLKAPTTAQLNRRIVKLIVREPRPVCSITAENGN